MASARGEDRDFPALLRSRCLRFPRALSHPADPSSDNQRTDWLSTE